MAFNLYWYLEWTNKGTQSVDAISTHPGKIWQEVAVILSMV